MITKEKESQIISNVDNSAHIVSIDEKQVSIAMRYLRDNIYSDKILAVVRENICNAIDSHRELEERIGKPTSKPIRIKFFRENISNTEYLSIKDFGVGLSEQDIYHVFGGYFKSTKNKDNKANGGFGIGAKSTWCLVDQFTIKSRWNGKLFCFSAYLDGDNGKILKLSEEDTEEPNGIEILIPLINVNAYDISSKISTFLTGVQYKNIAFTDFYSEGKVKWEKRIDEIDLGDGYKIFRTDNTSSFYCNTKIKMGDVNYDIHSNWIKEWSYLKNCIIEAPIGSFSLSISREKLEDTEENKQSFHSVLEKINDAKTRIISGGKQFYLRDCCSLKEVYYSPMKICSWEFNLHHLCRLNNAVRPVKKTIVFRIPKNQQTNAWENKAYEYVKNSGDPDIQYYCFAGNESNDSYFTQNNIIDIFEVVEFKSLKKRNKGGKARRGMGSNYRFGHMHTGSIQSFLDNYGNKKVDSLSDLTLANCYYNVIGKFEDDISHALSCSKVAYEVLVEEHGYFNANDENVQKRIDELVKTKNAVQQKENLIYSLQLNNLVVKKSRLRNARLELLERMNDIYQKKVSKPNNCLANKILASRYLSLTREEIRVILTSADLNK